MSGPWEDYAPQTAEEAGPWSDFGGGEKRKPAKPKRSLMESATGFMANVNRGLGVGDELAAVGGTVSALATGRRKGNPINVFKAELADQRQKEDTFAAERPNVAALARGTGMATTAIVPGLPVAAASSRMAGAAGGAAAAGLTAGAYGAVDRGTARERLSNASSAATNPFVLGLGAAGGAMAARPPAKAPKTNVAPPTERTPAQVVADNGVFLTPGQRMGGLAKSAEDVGQRAPILGTAIRGARQRGVVSLNRRVANEALAPLGEVVPKTVPTGHKSVAYVAKRLGDEYDAAAASVPQVARDPEFEQALAGIAKGIDELPTDVGAQFRSILANRLDGPLPAGAVVDGKQLRTVQAQIGNIAAKRSSSDDMAQQALGDMLENVSDELKNMLGRYSPEAGQRIAKANEGWSAYVRLRNAASKAKGGVAAPGQFATAVRMMDRSVGKGNVAKGEAKLQELIDAAWQVMPDAFGNPGTADAIGYGSLGVGMLNAPAATAPAIVGLSAAATPYFLMGRKVADAVPKNASRAELKAAADVLKALAANDPKVAALQQQVASRLSRAAGVAGGAQTGQRNIYAQPASGASSR